LFEENDYKPDTPTVGFHIEDGKNILNYTLDFSDEPYFSDLPTSDLPLMGKEYYVLSVGSDNESITLLDSAAKATIAEGETQTLTVGDKSYEVKITFVGTDKAKLEVNGETTDSLTTTGAPYKLSDGSYVSIRDIMYTSKESGVSKVELSIGKGKLVLENGEEVELNEETIDGVTAHIEKDNSGGDGDKLDKIVIEWGADDDLFITEDSEVEMPAFGLVKLSFGGLDYPAEEEIAVEPDGEDSVVLKNFPLKDSTEDINILYFNGTSYTSVGKDSDHILRTSGSTSLTFNGDTDDWFVVSWNDSRDFESYLMKVDNFKNESGTQKATFYYRKDGQWVVAKEDVSVENNPTVTLGNVEFEVASLDKDSKTAIITAESGVSFNVLYSKEGMRIDLPWINTTALNFSGNYSDNSEACANITGEYPNLLGYGALGYNGTVTYNITSTDGPVEANCVYFPATYNLTLTEEDEDGELAAGNKIVVTIGTTDSADEVKVKDVDMDADGNNESAQIEEGDTDVYRMFAYSALATEAKLDRSSDQYKVTFIYHGGEVAANVYLSEPTVSVTSGGDLGNVIILDTEVSSMKSKNLIIVGGSCVNSAAATLVGGAYCGSNKRWARTVDH